MSMPPRNERPGRYRLNDREVRRQQPRTPPLNQPGRNRRTRYQNEDSFAQNGFMTGDQQLMGGQRRMPHADPRRYPVGDAYDELVPRQGYAVPYRRQPAPPPPSKGLALWMARYHLLRQRANASSMSWWLMKTMQGVLTGGPLFVLGLVILVGNVLVWHDSLGAPILGGFFVIMGLGYMLYHGLAPWVQKWIVSVPNKHFYVVMLGDTHPVEYLPAGRLHVPFRFNSRITDYVNFSNVHTKDFYPDILQGYGPRIDLEVGVMMDFNPVEAHPQMYQPLLSMSQPDHFRRLIADTVYEAVYAYLGPFSPERWIEALQRLPELTRYLTDALWELTIWGLKPAGGQPITVFVHGLDIPAASERTPTLADPYADDGTTIPQAERTQARTYPTSGQSRPSQNGHGTPTTNPPRAVYNRTDGRSGVRRPPIGTDQSGASIPPFRDDDMIDYLAHTSPTAADDHTLVDDTIYEPPSPVRQTPPPDDNSTDTPDNRPARRATGPRDAPPSDWIRTPRSRRVGDDD